MSHQKRSAKPGPKKKPVPKAAPEKSHRRGTGLKVKTTVAGTMPLLRPGKYADGLPLHDLQYLAFKLILKPNRFTSRKSMFDFAKVFKEPAKAEGVKFSTAQYIDEPTQLREVLFLDTPDFRLYNNAFILRRRILVPGWLPRG